MTPFLHENYTVAKINAFLCYDIVFMIIENLQIIYKLFKFSNFITFQIT